MAKNCAIIPRVRNSKGNIVDSKLFKDLLSYTSNRKDAVRLYLITKNTDFIRDWYPKLQLDDNNEPTLSSLLKKTDFSELIPEKTLLEKLNKQIGAYKKGMNRLALWVNNDKNYQMLKERAINFNTTSEFKEDYVASVVKIWDSESNKVFIGIKVEKRNRLNSINADKMEYNESLNKKLRDILAEHGVAIGALTELEKRRGVHGVTDFDVAKDAATGLLEFIRLANGIEGERALPEEFAHFVIEAMGDNVLVNRLINYIHSKELVREIIGEDYETYEFLYKGDEAKLAKEAAGKLLAKHLLQHEDYSTKPYKSLLQRVIDAIKQFFKNISANSVQKAIKEADKNFGNLADQILNGSLDQDINIDNIKSNELFYNTKERINRDNKLLNKIIENEQKRLKIYEKRNPNSTFNLHQEELINKLKLELHNNSAIEGIYAFADSALDQLGKVQKRLIAIQNTPAASVNEKAKVLRDIRNYLYSYKRIIKDVKEALLEEESFDDNRYGQRVRVVVDNTVILLDDLFTAYQKVAMPLFVDFIKPFIGESIEVPFGKYKGKVMTAESIVSMAEQDISFFDRWLDSMADSSNPLLRVLDQIVKKSKDQARMDTINLSKKIQAAAIKLEQAGVKSTEWMFEVDDSGHKTGNYIQEINHGLYRKKYTEMIKSLKEKYGDNPIGNNARAFARERMQWIENNTSIIDGKRVPRKSLYTNKEFQQLNEAQKEFYNTIMSIKASLDEQLPENYTSLHSAVKIRKDLLERVKSSSITSGPKQIWESIKDAFIRRSDDTEFGDRATIKDFEGNEVQVLPIYYTKLREGENPDDISTDIVSTLTAYAAMANDYKEMNKIIDALELARTLVNDTESYRIQATRSNKPLIERFSIMGHKVENAVTKERGERRIAERLNDFFTMQVYQRYMADEGTVGDSKIDKAKAINALNRLTSLNVMGLNILSGISNVLTGKVMMRIESFAGEFFNESNTLRADRVYGQALPAYLAEIGSRVKTNKLALWDEYFDVLQEYEQDSRDLNFDRRNIFTKMFGTKAFYMINNAGEHWMQNRTSLALADRFKMKSPDGKIVSLWDAMEVVYIDENNKKLGAKLQVKKGYTKEDGTEFTKEDAYAFGRRAVAINERMHGIYNKADMSAIQRLALGRMAIMFRKWMKPSYNRRFKSVSYNFDLGEWTEGYYITSARFLKQLAKDLRQGQFSLAANYKKLTKTEKANIKRALTEVGHFLILAAALAFIDWPDDKDRPWLTKMIEYQTRRLYTELGVMVPSPAMASEGLKIVKSPAAGVNTIEDMLNLTGLLNPYNYEIFAGEDALIERGRYKGESEATRIILESPIIPMNKVIYKGLNPEEAIPFYKQ